MISEDSARMDYVYASLLGFVQGITEFLPISSSGHLVLLHELLRFNRQSNLTFDVALHAGTLIALILFFFNDSIQYIRRFRKFLLLIAVGILPAGVIGYFFSTILDAFFRSSWIVVMMLVLVSFLFFIVEEHYQPRLPLGQLRWWHALLIGFAQAIALIPGTSRSGITIATGMALGLERTDAARFSFLLIIPLLLGATIQQGIKMTQTDISRHEWLVMTVGALVAAVVGMVVIRYLLLFLQRYSLKVFAWYRLVLAVVVSLFLLV